MIEHREIIYSAKTLIHSIVRIQNMQETYVKKTSFERYVMDFSKLFTGDFKYQKLSSELYTLQGNMQSYFDKALEGLDDIQKIEASLLITPMIRRLLKLLMIFAVYRFIRFSLMVIIEFYSKSLIATRFRFI